LTFHSPFRVQQKAPNKTSLAQVHKAKLSSIYELQELGANWTVINLRATGPQVAWNGFVIRFPFNTDIYPYMKYIAQYMFHVEKRIRIRQFGKPGLIWKGNIKMNL
jgi:hypothetical protein